MAWTDAQELAFVEAALEQAYSAQSYSVGGRSKANADIGKLMKRRDELLDRINRASSGMFRIVQVDKPS